MSTEPPSDNRPNGHAEPQDDAGDAKTEPGQVEPNDQVSASAPGGSSDDSGRPPNPFGTPDPEQNANGEADGRSSSKNQNPQSKSLLIAFVIALSSAVLGLVGLGALHCVRDQYKDYQKDPGLWNDLVGSMFYDLSSPLYVVGQLVAVALDVLLALGILAMVALAAIWARFPLEAYKAVSRQIASRLLPDPPGNDNQVEVSKLAARIGIGTAAVGVGAAALVTVASVVTVTTVDVGPELNDAVREINTSMDKINTSMDETNTSARKINTSMDKFNTSMDKTNRSVRKIDSSMGKINRSVRKIDSSMVAIDSSMVAIDSSVKKTTQAVLDISAVRISPDSLAELTGPLRKQSVAMRTLNSTVADLGKAIRAETNEYTRAQEAIGERIRALENLGRWEAYYKIERDRRHILKRFQHFFRGRHVSSPPP